jgi:hypothetical protein
LDEAKINLEEALAEMAKVQGLGGREKSSDRVPEISSQSVEMGNLSLRAG